jgi:hypothetical protein
MNGNQPQIHTGTLGDGIMIHRVLSAFIGGQFVFDLWG